jgi:hypothetical protein
MKKNIFIFSIISLVISTIITSCTKNISITPANASGQLVIEGNLTNVSGPQYVTLSFNVPFNNSNTYPPVTGATVTISDQSGNIYLLPEGPPGTYSFNPLAGTAGTTYTLKAQVNGHVYTANSTMPSVVNLDSISAANNTVIRHPKNGNPSKFVTAYYQDPAGIANYYRFIMWVNGVQVNSIFTFDDLLSDGKYISQNLRETDIDVYSGDTVKVEMQCIDKPMYTYWYTLMQEQGGDINGTSLAPSNPPTNITPAAFGYFSAHTTQTMTIIVK